MSHVAIESVADRYALDAAGDVGPRLYEAEFRLREVGK